MELFFTISTAVFGISLILAIMGWVNILKFTPALAKIIGNLLVLSTIALGIIAAINYAPKIWNLMQ